MRLVNLTPHSITIRYTNPDAMVFDQVDYTLPSEGIARVATTSVPATDVATPWPGVPVVRTAYGAIEGLPEPTPDTAYIVSLIVLAALPGPRADVFAPATGPNDGAIRDARGQIVAVTRLVTR